jgi:UDP-N-acetylmuramyl pentapeptide phosphotransferase/UDP-N-acetylglucosamine-1-phosphate transferase
MTSRLLVGVVGAASSGGLFAWGRGRPTVGGLDWQRTNHVGEPVTLWEGAAYATGAAAGSAVAGSPAGVLAALGSAVFGALDDHRGDGSSRGLTGHLRALTRGEVTTGAVKIIGLGATGVACAALVDRRPASGRPVTGWLSTMVAGALIAGCANLGNLLDLRPGRTLKSTVIVGAPLLLGDGGATAAAAIGAAAGVIEPDLGGESMLGDTGANAAGAVLGVAAVESLGWKGRVTTLVAVTALTIASERVSFTRVIESTPVLRGIDRWGRRG